MKTCLIFNENFEECGIQKMKQKLVRFHPPIKINQIRCPRSNVIAHPTLPKIKNTYLENNFFFEIFGKKTGMDEFQLLCFHEVNTQKDVQDIVIALQNQEYLDTLIIRGDMDNKNQIIIYGQKCEDKAEERKADEKTEEQKLIELQSAADQQIKLNMEEIHSMTLVLPQKGDRPIQSKQEVIILKQLIGNFDYKHIQKIICPSEEDDFLQELQLTKSLKESKMQIESFLQMPLKKREVIYYKIQLVKVKENLGQLKTLKSTSIFNPCLLIKTLQDELKSEYDQILAQSVQGTVDFNSEILVGLQILKTLNDGGANLSKLVLNKEFIQHFFLICFGDSRKDFTLYKQVINNLFSLLFYKEFRDGLLIELGTEQPGCLNYAEILRDRVDFQFITPMEPEDMLESKKRQIKEERSEDEREKKKNELKKKLQKKEKKKVKDDWATSSEEVDVNEKLTELKGIVKENIKVGKQDIKGKQIDLSSVSQLLLKQMLSFTDNPEHFSVLKECNLLLGFVQYLRTLKKLSKEFIGLQEKLEQAHEEYQQKKNKLVQTNDLTKKDCLKEEVKDTQNGKREFKEDQREGNQEKKKDKYLSNIDYVNGLEDLLYYLKKVFKILRIIVKQEFFNKEKVEDTLTSVKKQHANIFKKEDDFYKNLNEQNPKNQTVLNHYLAKLFQEENLLPTLLVILNIQIIEKSKVFAEINKMICNICFTIMECKGGFSFLCHDFGLYQDLSESFYKLSKHKDSEDIFDSVQLNKFIVEDSSYHGQLIEWNRSQEKKIEDIVEQSGRDASTLVKNLQIHYLMGILLKVLEITQRIYKGFHAPEKKYELLQQLCELEELMQRGVLYMQAVNLSMKEPFMFQIMILLFQINSVDNYDTFQNEISVCLKVLTKILLFDDGFLLIQHHQKIIQGVKDIRKFQREYFIVHPEHLYEANNFKIDKQLSDLEKLTNSLKEIPSSFQIFINNVSRESRYVILDISTYLKKDFKFNSLIEPSFPFGNKKLMFQRFSNYLTHFKTIQQKKSPILYIVGVLKIFCKALDSNVSFFHKIVESNIFDIVDFVIQVSEFIVTVLLDRSQLGREVKKLYSSENREILQSFILLASEGIKLLRKKIKIKSTLLLHSQEYENVNLFQSVLRLLGIMGQINSQYFFNQIFTRTFELGELLSTHKNDEKLSINHINLIQTLRKLNLQREKNDFNQYIDADTRSRCNELTYQLVSMLKHWAKFPGSFQTIVSETIFSIFNIPHERHINFMILALLATEPRRIQFVNNLKDNFSKSFKALFFENVKTKKKSTLVLIQKFGACRSDSQFDLFITKNGFNSTIDYFLNTFIFDSNEEVYISLSVLVSALMEWKDYDYCEKAYKSMEKILKKKIEDFKHTFSNNSISPKVGFLFTNLHRILNFTFLLCSGGLFKKLLINDCFLTMTFDILMFLQNNKNVQEKYHSQYLQLILEFLRIAEVLLDPRIGFNFKQQGMTLTQESHYSEVMMNQDIEQLMKEVILINLSPHDEVLDFFKGIKTQISATTQLELDIFVKSIKLLDQITMNPKGLNEFFWITEKSQDLLMQLQCLRGFFLEVLIFYQGRNQSRKPILSGVQKMIESLCLYLKSIFNCCMDHEKQKIACYKERKINIKTGFFKGGKISQMLDQYEKLISDFREVPEVKQEVFQILLFIKSINKFIDKKSIKDQEPYENQQYKTQFRKSMEDYNKNYFLFEYNFNEFLDQKYSRFQNYNSFKIVNDVLKNKFSKTMLPKNFFKLSLQSCSLYLLKYKYDSDVLDVFFNYRASFYNEPQIYPEQNEVLFGMLNVLNQEVLFYRSINFFQPQQKVRNLYIKDLKMRNLELSIQLKPITPIQNQQDYILNEQKTDYDQTNPNRQAENGNYDNQTYYQGPYEQQVYGSQYYPDVSQQAYLNMYNQMVVTNSYYNQETSSEINQIPSNANNQTESSLNPHYHSNPDRGELPQQQNYYEQMPPYQGYDQGYQQNYSQYGQNYQYPENNFNQNYQEGYQDFNGPNQYYQQPYQKSFQKKKNEREENRERRGTNQRPY